MKKLSKKQIKELKSILLTKSGSVRKDYSNIKIDINALLKGIKVYYYTQTYSKGYVTTKDEYQKYRDLLNALQINFIEGNDAPRGGKSGQFIQLKRKRDFTFDDVIESITSEVNK